MSMTYPIGKCINTGCVLVADWKRGLTVQTRHGIEGAKEEDGENVGG